MREKEALITDADEKVLSLERTLFAGLIDEIRKKIPALQKIALGISILDVASALAETAQDCDYIRPQLDDSDTVMCRDVRHPVVERSIPGSFVPMMLTYQDQKHRL